MWGKLGHVYFFLSLHLSVFGLNHQLFQYQGRKWHVNNVPYPTALLLMVTQFYFYNYSSDSSLSCAYSLLFP